MRIHVRLNGRKDGSALMIALISSVFLLAMAGALLSVGTASKGEHGSATERMKALYIADGGLSRGIAAVTAGGVPSLGSAGAPIPFSDGSYWGTAVPVDEDTTTITVYGTSQGDTRGVEAVVVRSSEGLYAHALFAGNSSGNPNYALKFGGTGAQADHVNGNVYSGANVEFSGGATVDGIVRATGSISGGSGETGVTQPIPDLAGMNYAVNNDVNVAQQFAGPSARYRSNSSYGGSAWQLPESNPAHIFRKNPSNRATNINGTTKDDYFLEDVYESINTSNAINPSAGSPITFSGVDGEPGSGGNNVLYYIDGNLWVHNTNAFSFTMTSAGNTPLRVTFVVKGNIYISDNIFYGDPNQDGLALIAMKDESVPDSGNIYFGDPTFGTLEYMEAFMYAENNFYDNNLSASGSARVTVHGNMTAGNQVLINRDVGHQHSKLTVNFDSRIWDQDLDLPGIPLSDDADASYTVVSWREVGVP
jgi:hypothetical protein